MRAKRHNILISLLLVTFLGTVNAQWQTSFGPVGLDFIRVQCFNQIGTNLFAGTQGDGVWISTDNSMSEWTKVSSGITGKSVSALLVNGSNLFAGTDSGVFLSTNNGTSWTPINFGLTNTRVSSLALIGENLFAGTNGGGVFLSTNNGTDWTAVNNDLTSNYISSLAVIGTNLFAGNGGFGGGVFLSTNNGTNWTSVKNDLEGDYVFTLAASGPNIFAATLQGPSAQVYMSTNNGTNWTLANTGLPNSIEFSFAVIGTNVFAGAYSSGVYLTTNNGANWVEVNEGFGTSRTIRSLAVLGQDLFAGFYNGSVRRRPLSQMITSVDQISDLRPTQFYLDQNYPNPFNPTTTFRFSIPKEEYVALKVYDAFGQEVATLISEGLQTGQYEKQWDASGVGYASGVYYYRLQTGNYNQTKKLILIK